jgi:hypothetical protein
MPPPKRSGSNTWVWVILGIFGALLLFAVVGLAVFMSTEAGQKTFEVVKRGTEWAMEAQNAPGTEEMRGAGCQTAMVADMSDMMYIAQPFLEDEDMSEMDEQLMQTTMLICQVGGFGTAPDCPDVVRAYASGATTDATEVMVQVQKQGSNQPSCQGMYDLEGNYLRSVEDMGN